MVAVTSFSVAGLTTLIYLTNVHMSFIISQWFESGVMALFADLGLVKDELLTLSLAMLPCGNTKVLSSTAYIKYSFGQ